MFDSAMFIDVLLLLLGLGLVGKGGGVFVDSSIEFARRFRIPRIVVGGTIVSLATTMPETVVSVTASLMGDSGIAVGNAVGSAIANIGLIVGTVALITRVAVERDLFNRRARFMVAAAVLAVVLLWPLELSRWGGWLLLAVAAAYLVVDLVRLTHGPEEVNDARQGVAPSTTLRLITVFLFGAALVLLGSRLLVTSGVQLATAIGIPSAVIGLSIVAVGTSLPELVTGIVAARKGVPDLSIGNILGANVLNLSLILGLVSVIHPAELSPLTRNYSFPWLLIFVFSIVVMLRRDGTLVTREGSILLAAYVTYLLGLAFLI